MTQSNYVCEQIVISLKNTSNHRTLSHIHPMCFPENLWGLRVDRIWQRRSRAAPVIQGRGVVAAAAAAARFHIVSYLPMSRFTACGRGGWRSPWQPDRCCTVEMLLLFSHGAKTPRSHLWCDAHQSFQPRGGRPVDRGGFCVSRTVSLASGSW